VHLLMPSKAFKMATILTKMIGEPLAAMASAPARKGKELDLTGSLPTAVKALTANLADEGTLQMVKDLVGTCTYNNAPINFESHFQGKLGHLFKLVAVVVEVQFKDFFEAIIGQVKGMMKAAE